MLPECGSVTRDEPRDEHLEGGGDGTPDDDEEEEHNDDGVDDCETSPGCGGGGGRNDGVPAGKSRVRVYSTSHQIVQLK